MIGDPRQMRRNKKWQNNFYTMVTAKTATETKSKSNLGLIIIKFFVTHVAFKHKLTCYMN